MTWQAKLSINHDATRPTFNIIYSNDGYNTIKTDVYDVDPSKDMTWITTQASTRIQQFNDSDKALQAAIAFASNLVEGDLGIAQPTNVE
jgi:hypothetical protein